MPFFAAALERVPEIKPSDVEEVFFGNVLSAKSGPLATPIYSNGRLTIAGQYRPEPS